jgi:hypothetical protein
LIAQKSWLMLNDAMSTPTPRTGFSMAELEQVINRARAQAPATGSEATLSAQVARLGSVYGRMIYEKREQAPWSWLAPEDRAWFSAV